MTELRPCRIDGCENLTGKSGTARGLCHTHYRRWQRYGDPNAPVRRLKSYPEEATCLHVDCERRPMAQGLCDTHYARVRRAANPDAQKRRQAKYKQQVEAERVRLAGRPRPEICELCGEEGSTVWDHDHETGRFRGWLCHRCNRTLGQVRDDEGLLRKMITYLEASSDDQADSEEAPASA